MKADRQLSPDLRLLYKEGVEIPSDIHGALYVPYDAGNGWRLKLANEIEAAGIAVSLNLASVSLTMASVPVQSGVCGTNQATTHFI